MKIKSEFINALKFLVEKFKDVEWVLIGSMSLALQGVNVEPHDIDILTTKEGAYKINELLKSYEVEKVEWKKSEKYKSHIGKFVINGIQVEVIGDFWIKDEEKWMKREFEKIIVKESGLELPCSSLEASYRAYKLTNSPKVKKIEEVLFKGEG